MYHKAAAACAWARRSWRSTARRGPANATPHTSAPPWIYRPRGTTHDSGSWLPGRQALSWGVRSVGMKGRALVACVLALAAAPAGAAPTIYGPTGLVTIPTARTLDYRTIL